MEIREYTPSDFESMKTLHELCGFDYSLPDLSAPQMAVRRVVLDGSAMPMAGFLRLTAEAYLLIDAQWKSPAWRWEMLKRLHEDMRQKAKETVIYKETVIDEETVIEEARIEDVFCWPPREIAKKFGKRLEALGWQTNAWPTYFRRVE